MASGGCPLTEDQLQCDVCLGVFCEPVTVPCGHTFCLACVEQRWEDAIQRRCPTCGEAFAAPPPLRLNRVIADMTLDLRGAPRSPPLAEAGDVPCDVCSEPKRRASRSCLACLASYCEAHLKPHLSVARLRQHPLSEPTRHLERRVCARHLRPLQLFCRTDQTCVCTACPVQLHRSHDIGLLKDEYEKKRAELGRQEEELWEMIQERRRAVGGVRRGLKLGRSAAQREVADGARLFAALAQSLRRAEAELVGEVEERQRAAEARGRALVRELEEEVAELLARQAELERLGAAADHLHFLQGLRALSPAPPARDWTAVSVSPPPHEGAVRAAVERLLPTLNEEAEALAAGAELNRLRQFAVDVTFDPDTAHSALLLSADGKRVHHGVGRRKLPDGGGRFDPCCCVVARQAFSTGRFYFEVQVEGKSRWTVGVANAGVQRKGVVPLSPENGHWTVWLKNGNQYAALVGTPRPLTPKAQPRRVGVFVDMDGRQVSFYDGDTAAVLHSFAGCSFGEKLLPFFSPGLNDDGANSAPLVIVDPAHVTAGRRRSGRFDGILGGHVTQEAPVLPHSNSLQVHL